VGSNKGHRFIVTLDERTVRFLNVEAREKQVSVSKAIDHVVTLVIHHRASLRDAQERFRGKNGKEDRSDKRQLKLDL
jgi:hypothetical protein